MELLVVEDEALLRHHLYIRLGEQGYVMDAIPDAEEAFCRVDEYRHDLAVIDLDLSDMSGLNLIHELCSQDKSSPTLILTTRGNWQDKVKSLAAEADDYVAKPFQFEKLEARLNALLRRSSGLVQSTIEADPLVLDLNRKQALVEEQPVALTAYEYHILKRLMRHHQQVVTKGRLMEQLYPDNGEHDTNVIEVLIGRLRHKLKVYGGFKSVDAVRSWGYLFTERCR